MYGLAKYISEILIQKDVGRQTAFGKPQPFLQK